MVDSGAIRGHTSGPQQCYPWSHHWPPTKVYVLENVRHNVHRTMYYVHRTMYNVHRTLHYHWSHWRPYTPQLTLPRASSCFQEDKRKFVKTANKDDDGIRKEQWFQIVPNLSLNLTTPIGTFPRKKPLTACPQNTISIYHA